MATLRIAGNIGLSSLYHYQDFNLRGSDDHVGRLTDILQNHRVWCSNPATFNDPWDCKPYFVSGKDPKNRAATALWLSRTGHGGAGLNQDLESVRWGTDQFSARLLDLIPSRLGVYCLSPDPCLTLMWSHYARNHKGICLEFAVRKNEAFHYALKVRYQKKYPTFHLNDPGFEINMLLVKSDDWRYEKEFRLICPRHTDPRFTDADPHSIIFHSIAFHSPLITVGNYLQIGPVLTSIILGCQIEDEAAAKIGELAREHAPHVRVRRARRASNQYRLVVED